MRQAPVLEASNPIVLGRRTSARRKRPCRPICSSGCSTHGALDPTSRDSCGTVDPGCSLSVLISVEVVLARRSSDEALPPALLMKGRGPRSVRIRLSQRRSSSMPLRARTTPLGRWLAAKAHAIRVAAMRLIWPLTVTRTMSR